MTPAEYFHDMVEPTITEFEAEPTSKRRAYLACVVAYHFADAAAAYTKRKPREVENELKGLDPDLQAIFQTVRDVANLAKHLELNPKYLGNKDRPLPKIGDVGVGPEPAFTDGTFFSDGTSWSDAEDGVRIEIGGRWISLRWCLGKARAAIEQYLARPDMR